MTDDYKWENPNSKIVEYGGPALGGVLIWLGILFYPAVVVGIQVGLFYTSYDDALIPGTIAFLLTLLVIWILCIGSQVGNITCRVLLIALYLICLPPFIQYVSHVSNAEYIQLWEYEERIKEMGKVWDPCFDYDGYSFLIKEPFPGFDWWWWKEPLGDWIVTILIPVTAILLIVRWILKSMGKI